MKLVTPSPEPEFFSNEYEALQILTERVDNQHVGALRRELLSSFKEFREYFLSSVKDNMRFLIP